MSFIEIVSAVSSDNIFLLTKLHQQLYFSTDESGTEVWQKLISNSKQQPPNLQNFSKINQIRMRWCEWRCFAFEELSQACTNHEYSSLCNQHHALKSSPKHAAHASVSWFDERIITRSSACCGRSFKRFSLPLKGAHLWWIIDQRAANIFSPWGMIETLYCSASLPQTPLIH
jgi:hypothetical protein